MGVQKRKETVGLRGKDSIPGVIKSWISNSMQELLQVQLGHPEVCGQVNCDTHAVSPRSPGGIDVHRVSPALRPLYCLSGQYQH